MRKNQVIGAMLMAVMTLFALPSCDKDETCEGEKTETPKDATAIEKATLGKKVLVDELADANTITWLKTAKFDAFAAKVAEFSNKAAVAIGIDGDDNIAVSPLSVFMALAMSADCANGDTRQELLDALGVTIDDLRTMNMRSLCYLMNRTLEEPVYYNDASSTDPYSTSPDKAKNFIKCVNSLWVRGDVQVKEDIERIDADWVELRRQLKLDDAFVRDHEEAILDFLLVIYWGGFICHALDNIIGRHDWRHLPITHPKIIQLIYSLAHAEKDIEDGKVAWIGNFYDPSKERIEANRVPIEEYLADPQPTVDERAPE